MYAKSIPFFNDITGNVNNYKLLIYYESILARHTASVIYSIFVLKIRNINYNLIIVVNLQSTILLYMLEYDLSKIK